jgi:hypothetical protein
MISMFIPLFLGGAGFRATIHSSYGMDMYGPCEKLDDFCHPMRSQEDIFGNKEGFFGGWFWDRGWESFRIS